MELDNQIYEEITEYCRIGDSLFESSDYDAAIKNYDKALDLLPDPKEIWEASTWIHTAKGDALFFKAIYDESLNEFIIALKGPNGLGNPFINLRIGQCYFELQNFEQAKNYLLQAYMVGGVEVFEAELEKYYNCIKEMI